MQKFYRQMFILTILVLALLGLAATPAAANVINSANVSLTCSSYTINVSGSNLDTANVSFSVNYTFNVDQRPVFRFFVHRLLEIIDTLSRSPRSPANACAFAG